MSASRAIVSSDPTLFNPESGRLDAARIAQELNLPIGTIAEAIGRKAAAVRKNLDASGLQAQLRRIYRIWVSLVELYAGNRAHARTFLNTPNPHLENQAPIALFRAGDLTPLEALVEAMSIRQPA